MTDIPPNIKGLADTALDLIAGYLHDGERGNALAVLAAAIHTERERAAVIAFGFHKINPQAKFIAEAIRKGE